MVNIIDVRSKTRMLPDDNIGGESAFQLGLGLGFAKLRVSYPSPYGFSPTPTPHPNVPGESAFQYNVQVSSLAMIERLFGAVEALDDVVCVRRGDLEHMLHDSLEGFWAHAERPAAEEEEVS